jgi:hypothetical protein
MGHGDLLFNIEINGGDMNERIKELAEQAGFEYSSQWKYWTAYENELELFAELVRQDYLRELKALKPVAYMDSKGILFNNTTHPQLNTALYALDEVTK